MKHIAFHNRHSLYVIPSKGGQVSRLTVSPRGCDDSGPRWSPIGPSVVFLRTCNTGIAHRIELLDVKTKRTTIVTQDGAINAKDEVASPDFMPSGKRISFTAQCASSTKCVRGDNFIVTTTLTGADRRTATQAYDCNDEVSLCDTYLEVHALPNGRGWVYTMYTNGGECVFVTTNANQGWCGGPDAGEGDVQPVPK